MNPQVGSLRPNFLKNALLGYDEILTLANGEKHKVHYAIVDLDEILASHNEGTFVTTKGYPLNATGANINDRNYLHDTNAQKQVVEYAQNLDAERIISTSVNVSGTPIITVDGIVISGNNRTMSTKLAARQYPEKYEEYKKVLLHKIKRGGYGIEEKALTALILGDQVINPNVENPTGTFYTNQYLKIRKPFLVRVDYDFAAYNTAEMAKYNQDTKKGESPVDRAIKLGAIFAQSPRCQEAMINELSYYDTFSDFYANYSSQNHIKKQLIDCNIITEAQMSSYYEQGFTSAGKDLIESLAAGMVLEREPLIAANLEGVKIFRQIIIGSLTVLLKNRGFKDGFSLIPAINEAVVLQKKMHSSKLTITDYVLQLSVFDAKPTRDGLLLHQLLSAGKIIFKKSIEAYNYSVADTQGASLFGEKPTKEQILRTHIVSKLNPKIVQFLDRIYPVSNVPAQAVEASLVAPTAEKVVASSIEEVPSLPQREYKYVMALRPFDIGTYPKENFLRFEEATSPDERFGIVVYSKPIPKKELSHFSLDALLDKEQFAPGKKFIMADADYTFYITILESTATSLLVNARMPENDFDETDPYGSNQWLEMMEQGKVRPVEQFPFERASQPVEVMQADPFTSLLESKNSWEMSLEEFKKYMPSPAMGTYHRRADGKYEERREGNKRKDVYGVGFVHYHVLIDALQKGLPVKWSNLVSNSDMVQPKDLADHIKHYPSLVDDSDTLPKLENQGKREHFEKLLADLKAAGVVCKGKVTKTSDNYPIHYEIATDQKVSKDEVLRVIIWHGDNRINVTGPEGGKPRGSYKVHELDLVKEYLITTYHALKQQEQYAATTGHVPFDSNRVDQIQSTEHIRPDAIEEDRSTLSGRTVWVKNANGFYNEAVTSSSDGNRVVLKIKDIINPTQFVKTIEVDRSKVLTEQPQETPVALDKPQIHYVLYNGEQKQAMVTHTIGQNLRIIQFLDQYGMAEGNHVVTATSNIIYVNEPAIEQTSSNEEELETSQSATKVPSLADHVPGLEIIKSLEPIGSNSMDHSRSIVNGEYFTKNPEKVLGTLKAATTRFGKIIHIVTGTLSVALTKIPYNLPSTMKESVNETVIAHELPVENQVALENLSKAIENTKNAVVKHLVAEKQFKTGRDCGPVYCFEEALQDYNPQLTKGEIECYVWYKWSQGEQLGGMWSIMFHYSYSEDTFTQWLQNGVCCYDGSAYVYAPIFYSGNLYQKISLMKQNASKIIEVVGEQQFNKQIDTLEKLFPPKLSITDPNAQSRLKINPISNFAKQFTISSLKDGIPFTRMSYKHENGKYVKAGIEEYNQSLNQSFRGYLSKLTANEFRNGATSNEVISFFLDNASLSNPKKDKQIEADNMRKKQRAMSEGLRLFDIFLREELSPATQLRIDYEWNQTYNGFKKINYDKIPIAFEFGKFYNGDVSIRPEKREGVAFILNEGSGIIAYDVGVGKTFCAIFTIAQFMAADYCRRPLIVVPNQVYKQFIAEIKGLLPTIKVNEYYNLGVDMAEKIADGGIARQVDEYSITVVTKDALELIGFTQTTEADMLDVFYDILNQGDTQSAKEKAALREKLQTLMGRGIKGSLYNLEDFGFDFFCCDEAHMLKKVFTSVKGDLIEREVGSGDSKLEVKSRDKSPYKIQSGQPSAIALKGFMISHYIQHHNQGRNVLLLTATPFTNSPLEIYSMLALVAYNKLEAAGVNNLKAFFDTYVATSNELVISAKMKPERKQVVMGFDNLVAMQQLIRRFINYKTGEDVGVERPNKIVLPLLNKKVDGVLIPLSDEERIETKLPMTAQQKRYMQDVENYMNEASFSFEDLCTNQSSMDFVEDEDAMRSEGIEVDESTLSSDEKQGVKVLRGLSLARNIALSPHLYSCSQLGMPTYKSYIEQSPKLQYVIECIRRIKMFCEANRWPVPGVIIYMDRGTDFFQHIKDYLQYEIGYTKDEVGIAISGIAAARKESIKNKFLGIGYDEKTGMNFDLPEEKRIKVLIGSSTIKEGMNLQKRAAFIFNCFLDWNPTDVKQLEGRIWRYGNIYKHTFIINPLMENSIDSFIFQKLQEKTSRINEIFADNNRENTLKLEELNPAELKTALITDPYKIAESEIQVIGERLQDKIDGIRSDIAGVERYKEAIKKTAELTEKLRDNLRGLAKEAKELDKIQKADVKALLRIMNDFLETNRLDYAYSFTYELQSVARTKFKGDETILKAYGLTYETLDTHTQKLEAQIEQVQKEKTTATAKDAIQKIADEIIEQRKRENYNSKSVMERVEEFAKVLPLLAERMEYGKKSTPVVPQAVIRPKFNSVPPMDADGKRLITEEAIAFLEEQIAKQESTKKLYINEQGIYTGDRQALHAKIVAEFTQNKPCQTKQPVAILTGGLPGSGKSTFLKKSPYKWINDSSKLVHVDADEVRAKLPEYRGWNANATHDETKDVVNMILDQIGIPCTYDLVYDGTMNKMKNYIPLIEKLRNYGYQIYVLFVRVPFEVSKERVLKRYQNSGRFVPITVIEEAYAAGDTALNQIKTMVDGYIVVDGVTYEELEKGGKSIPQSREYMDDTDQVRSDVGQATAQSSAPATDRNEGTPADNPMNYVEYILGEIKKKFVKQFPEAIFDKQGLLDQYNEWVDSHGQKRATSNLEDIYTAYFRDQDRVAAWKELQDNYYNLIAKMKQSSTVLTAIDQERSNEDAAKVKKIKLARAKAAAANARIRIVTAMAA
ncbi:zeta toxin family protein [Rhodocytophaga aerolata]|uniref:zeta toxin family protein n=1 Tax=Rhodocytophaga aerolata TaxID=455078 RepID=UPI00362043D5